MIFAINVKLFTFVCNVLFDHIYFVFDLDWITDSLVITEIFFLGSIRGNILLSTEGLQISTINMRTPCDKLMMSLKTKYFHTLSLPYIQERTKPKSSENHVIPMMINILKMILKLLLFRCVRGDTRYSLDSNLVNFQVSNNFLVVNMKKTRFVVWKENTKLILTNLPSVISQGVEGQSIECDHPSNWA